MTRRTGTRQTTGASDRVVIVGAGLAGLSTALRLAGTGREVTVLERDSGPEGARAYWRLPATGSTPGRPCSRCPS